MPERATPPPVDITEDCFWIDGSPTLLSSCTFSAVENLKKGAWLSSSVGYSDGYETPLMSIFCISELSGAPIANAVSALPVDRCDDEPLVDSIEVTGMPKEAF